MAIPTLASDATFSDGEITFVWDGVFIEAVPSTAAVLTLSLPSRDYSETFGPDDAAFEYVGDTIAFAVPVEVYETDTIVIDIDAGFVRDENNPADVNAAIDEYAVLNRSTINPPTRTIDLTVNLTGTITLSGDGVSSITLTSPSGTVSLKA